MEKVNLSKKLAAIERSWVPGVVGELNDQMVKLARFEGEYVWHQHENEDEMFLVLDGQVDIRLRDRVISLDPGEFFIVPRGVEHQPAARGVAHVLLFEPGSTRNTGNVDHQYTIEASDLENL